MKSFTQIVSWLKSKGSTREKVAGLVVLAFFVLVFFAIPHQVPPSPNETDPLARSPRFFPYLVTIMAMVLSVGVLIRGFFGSSADTSGHLEGRQGVLGLAQVRRVAPVILIALIYLLLFNLLGYIIAIILCFAAFLWYYGLSFRKQWKVAIPLVILLPLLLYYVFKSLLYVPLPSGILELFGIY